MNNNTQMENGKQPAFPCVGYGQEGNSWYQAGMSIREYFAAMAMQGMLASANPHYQDAKIMAESAVIYTDALLHQLNSPK